MALPLTRKGARPLDPAHFLLIYRIKKPIFLWIFGGYRLLVADR